MHWNRPGLTSLFLVFLLFSAFSALAQEATDTRYAHFRALTYSGDRFEGRDATITGGHLLGKDSDGQELVVSLDDIKALDVANGTRAGVYTGMGAGIGLLTAISAIWQVDSDPHREVDSSKVVPVTAVAVGAGALIGLLVGSNSPLWERYELNKSVGLITLGESCACGIRVAF